MSEERKMILQMLAEGKINPQEAETLLEALAAGKRAAPHRAAVRGETHTWQPWLSDLGNGIERAVSQGLRGLERSLEGMEADLERRLKRHEAKRLRLEERIRRATRRAVERATEAEERVRFFKTGIHVDREQAEVCETHAILAEPGDRIVLDNQVGDVAVAFYEGNQIEVAIRKTTWGGNQADAAARSAATRVTLARHRSDVEVLVTRPQLIGVGLMMTKESRLDYTIRAPLGTHLDIKTKVGNIGIGAGRQVGDWNLRTAVGQIEVQLLPEAGFQYFLETKVGEVVIDLPDAGNQGTVARGRVGDGSGRIHASVATGDIRLYI